MSARLKALLKRKLGLSTRDRSDGATVVEYAVLLALIVVVILASVSSLGNKVAEIFKIMAAAIP